MDSGPMGGVRRGRVRRSRVGVPAGANRRRGAAIFCILSPITPVSQENQNASKNLDPKKVRAKLPETNSFWVVL